MTIPTTPEGLVERVIGVRDWLTLTNHAIDAETLTEAAAALSRALDEEGLARVLAINSGGSVATNHDRMKARAIISAIKGNEP